jgi:phage tail sheath gpL-like
VAVAAILSPILVVGGVWLTIGFATAPSNDGFTLNVNPSATVWHPNPQNAAAYCATVAQLPQSDPALNVWSAGIAAELAPNLADRQATMAYYDDVRHLRPSSNDLAKVTATCPS